MPSEVAQRNDKKLFSLRGENEGLPLQAYEVAWTGKRRDHSVFIGVAIGLLISVLIVASAGAIGAIMA